MKIIFTGLITLLLSINSHADQHSLTNDGLKLVKVIAHDKYERTKLSELGIDLEGAKGIEVVTTASNEQIDLIRKNGFTITDITESFLKSQTHSEEGGWGGEENRPSEPTPGESRDFPSKDARYHTHAEFKAVITKLENDYSNLIKVFSIGKTWEGRDIFAIQINTSSNDRERGQSTKPGVLFLGNHHAREHLSLEMPLMLTQYLAMHANDEGLKTLIENRDIWIIAQVNPDGSEYDVKTGEYQWWRKNRRDNKDGRMGVDLNRNYGYMWNRGGSSSNTSSDTYMGPAPFSEPETQTIKKFVEDHANLKTLLSFHTFSELILYPWGYTYDPIGDKKDLAVFETMAKKMSTWNGYKAQQASDLYIASGVTDDWAYAEHKIFSFTFELTPSSIAGGGFYPGHEVIDPTFKANLKPCLYMIEVADNPYKVLSPHLIDPVFGYMGPNAKDFY